MKKFIFTLLCVLTCLFCFVFSSYASSYETGKYLVTSAGVSILDSASILAEKKGEVPKNTYLEITQVQGFFGYCEMKDTGISGWVLLENLTPVSQPSSSSVTKIEISSLPKTVYTQDEETFNRNELKVNAVFADGTKKEISKYEIYCPSFSSYGTKTVVVRYSPENSSDIFTASFNVTINKVPLASLSVSSAPTKTDYMENGKLDLTGLALKAKYTDGRSDRYFTLEEILSDSDFSFSACHNEKQGTKLSPGTHTIRISYKYADISTSFTLNVTKKNITELTIKTMPTSLTVYYNTLIPTLDGMVLTATYDNGESEDIPAGLCRIICTPSNFIIGDGNKVTVQYKGLSVSINLRYTPLEEEGITLSLPAVLTFEKGEEVNLSELKVFLKYNSGKQQEVTDYKISKIDNLTVGVQNVVVSYKEFSEVFSIFITAVYSKGDVTGDGNIKAEDARLILRAAVGLTSLEGKRFTAGDVNKDGKISAADARLALRAAVGLEDLFKKN